MEVVVAAIFISVFVTVAASGFALYRIAHRQVPQISDYELHRRKYIASGDESELAAMVDAAKNKEV